MSSIFPGIPHVESPVFGATLDALGFSEDERRVAVDLHEKGYSVIDFPDPELDGRIKRIKAALAPRFGIDPAELDSIKNSQGHQRIQDAWLFNDDVKAIAVNAQILDLLAKLYGRRPFPFQTLNFPVGTQQHLHSDSNHFSSLPERFMCGVWLAMEDVHADAGPLTYLPGSHKWPILTNVMIGRRAFGAQPQSAQSPFEAAWQAMSAVSGAEQEVFLARKGQALIWAANLLHGGSLRADPTRSRWSQVSHYYFDDCIYYTPAFSDEPVGRLDLRPVINIATGDVKPSMYLGQELAVEREIGTKSAKSRPRWWLSASRVSRALPEGFDPQAYLFFNPDVEAAGIDPADHYVKFGAREGRRFRRG